MGLEKTDISFMREESERAREKKEDRRQQNPEMRSAINMLLKRLQSDIELEKILGADSTASQLEKYILAAPAVRDDQKIWQDLTPAQQQAVEKLIAEGETIKKLKEEDLPEAKIIE